MSVRIHTRKVKSKRARAKRKQEPKLKKVCTIAEFIQVIELRRKQLWHATTALLKEEEELETALKVIYRFKIWSGVLNQPKLLTYRGSHDNQSSVSS